LIITGIAGIPRIPASKLIFFGITQKIISAPPGSKPDSKKAPTVNAGALNIKNDQEIIIV